MADTTLADAFTQNYTAMQGNQRANAMSEAQIAQQQAEQHWRDAQLALQQQAQEYAQDPNSPPNLHLAAQADQARAMSDYYTNRLPSMERQAEIRAAAQEARTNMMADKAAAQDSRDRVAKGMLAWEAGTSPSIVVNNLAPEDRAGFQKGIQDTLKAEYQNKLNSRANQIFQTLRAVNPAGAGAALNGPAPQPAPNAVPPSSDPLGLNMFGVSAGATGATGTPASQGMPVAPVQPSGPTDDQLHAQALMQATQEIGTPPDENAWMTAVHPKFAETQRRNDAIIAQQQAHTQMFESATDRNRVQAQLAPQLFKLKQDALDERTSHDVALENQMANNLKWKKFYEGTELINSAVRNSIMQTNANINQQRANQETPQAKIAIADAAQARGIAKWELQHNITELDKVNTAINKIQKQASDLRAFLPPPGTDPNAKVAVAGTTYTAGQLNALVSSYEADLNEQAPGSLKSRKLDLQNKINELGGLVNPATSPGADRSAVGSNGKPLMPKPGALPPVGGMGTGRPVTPQEYQSLPSGSRYLAPDGQYHIKS